MHTLRVLVADDEAGMRHSIKRALRNHMIVLPSLDDEVNFQVDDVESGELALERIDADPPDILLLDHKMGGMSGIEVLQELAKKPDLELLTVMITAFATIETAVKATKQGAWDFIAKPFTPEELKETIYKVSDHLIAQRQARKLAEERRKVRFEFIRVLGHELKAPLGAVENYLNIMKDKALGDEIASYEDVVERCRLRTEGMRKLIIDLLDMTRIEAGEKKREFTDVDVVALANESIENVQIPADERGITVAYHGDDSLMMKADSGEVQIILNNLISNAVRYNRDNGTVDVTLSADDEWVTMAVADTGIGMKPEEKEKLFKDFVRIKNEKTRNIVGSGLGLSILDKLTHLYGGTIKLESEWEVGSTFTVALKRYSDPAAATEE